MPTHMRAALPSAMHLAMHVLTYGRTDVRSGYSEIDSSLYVTRTRAYADLDGFGAEAGRSAPRPSGYPQVARLTKPIQPALDLDGAA